MTVNISRSEGSGRVRHQNNLDSIRSSMSRPDLKNFRRIVVKVGSSLLVDSDAGEVRTSWLAALAADLASCMARAANC